MKRVKCTASENTEVFSYCEDLLSIIEDDRPSIKGVVEIQQTDVRGKLVRNYVVAKQGVYRYKGLAFNNCPFCGESVRLRPSSLIPSVSE